MYKPDLNLGERGGGGWNERGGGRGGQREGRRGGRRERRRRRGERKGRGGRGGRVKNKVIYTGKNKTKLSTQKALPLSSEPDR